MMCGSYLRNNAPVNQPYRIDVSCPSCGLSDWVRSNRSARCTKRSLLDTRCQGRVDHSECQLRELSENTQARGNLRQHLSRSRAFAHEHGRLHRSVLQSHPTSLGVGLSFSRGIRTASCVARASGELRERNASVLRAMTNMLGKFFSGRGRRRPLPQVPVLRGRREETQTTASVSIESCLIRGVQSENMGPIRVQ